MEKLMLTGGVFEGLSMEEARVAVVQALKDKGLLERIEPHIHRVGISYRSKAVIEPYMSKQWFVKISHFANQLKTAVIEGRTKILPKTWENTYFHWIDNLRDWCISRQLWWGHRIPIWYHKEDPSRIICYAHGDLPEEVRENPEAWTQDEDVLDTWFSSALWPFSALGWPEKTQELKRFYPNATLVTGHDILFFWVARMLFMGEYALGQLPFPETFLHGLIYGKSYWRTNVSGITYVTEQERVSYDLGKPVPANVQSRWEKMSKSQGNIIDPLEIIEEYGTDAMRMALCASATQSREIDLDRRRFEEFRNFANKIWNGARFIFLNLEGDSSQNLSPLTVEEFSQGLNETLLSLEDHWILSTLTRVVKDVNEYLESYQFDQAALQAYDFFWKEFCAYYIEISKPILFGKRGTEEERKNKQKLLIILLCQSIRLIHPMAPFITEELFQRLKKRFLGITSNSHQDPYTKETIKALLNPACMVSSYPKTIRISDLNQEINDDFRFLSELVYTIRNIRGEMRLPPSVATDVFIFGKEGESKFELVKKDARIIHALVRIQSLEISSIEKNLGFSSTGVLQGLKIAIPLPQQHLKQEMQRLEKEKQKLELNLEKLDSQLSNKNFVVHAPKELIEKQKELFERYQKELEELKDKLTTAFSNLPQG